MHHQPAFKDNSKCASFRLDRRADSNPSLHPPQEEGVFQIDCSWSLVNGFGKIINLGQSLSREKIASRKVREVEPALDRRKA
jgi:hypothetical protein